MAPLLPARLAPLLAISGAAALICEVVWMRRLSLALGSTGEAVALTLGLYMAGLGLGSGLAARRRWAAAPRGYGALELGVAAWALLVPGALVALAERGGGGGLADLALAVGLLVPPGILHGATLPAAVAATAGGQAAAVLYASNTAGAVLGALLGPFLLMPAFGVTGAERAGALAAAAAGLAALRLGQARAAEEAEEAVTDVTPALPARPIPVAPLLAVGLSGLGALALEVAWARLGALLLGGSVYALSVVLAVFLAGIALGAAAGRRLGARALGPALGLLGVGATLGLLVYGHLPHALALAWARLGDGALLPAGALLLALAMGAVPLASGAVFSAALGASGPDPAVAAGRVLVANTAGAVTGSIAAGLWALPTLGVQGVVSAVALLCAGVAALLPGNGLALRLGPLAAVGALLLLAPPWDARLYAVGLVHKLDQFADPSPRAIDRYAHEGWELRLYRDGVSATIAVGEGRNGTRWLSSNGKVDASSGEDMPTQVWSGRLPVGVARAARPAGELEALVVGLASGVTAGEALAAGADRVTVVEIEPAVLEAARHFEPWNHGVVDDPRATLVVDDARAWLRRQDRRWPVIVSEPSNPWITGVSNLFTREYWALARSRLEPGGVFCQWMQLYALPPSALRSLIRTFLAEFPSAWLFETIPGADVLLVAAPALPADLPLEPTLGPEGLALLAGRAPLNTDDRPWIEFEAPRWLLRSTGSLNREMIAEAAARSGGAR